MIFVYIRIFIVIHNREKYLKNNSSYRIDKSISQERQRLKQQQVQSPEFSTYLQSNYDIPSVGKKIYYGTKKTQKNEQLASETDSRI